MSKRRILVRKISTLLPYAVGESLQYSLVNLMHGKMQVNWPVEPVLLLVQHLPTYTAGRRFKNADTDEEVYRLRQTGAEYFKALRGGQTTFHGPGQLVGYPILNLKDLKLGVRSYVDLLQDSLIDTCALYDINTHSTSDTGVWVDGQRKIAALGIHVSRYISSHGFALNCNVDLSWFDNIVPCGIPDKGVTSISHELSRLSTVDAVTPNLIKCLESRLQVDLVSSEVNPELDDYISKIIS